MCCFYVNDDENFWMHCLQENVSSERFKWSAEFKKLFIMSAKSTCSLSFFLLLYALEEDTPSWFLLCFAFMCFFRAALVSLSKSQQLQENASFSGLALSSSGVLSQLHRLNDSFFPLLLLIICWIYHFFSFLSEVHFLCFLVLPQNLQFSAYC